jgi:WD40 repeat protein
MLAGRGGHTATLLPNGKLLVSGGDAGAGLRPLSSAELYDPAAQTWAPTGSLTTPRNGHTATLLLNGKVLVAGGSSDGQVVFLSSAELYDLTTGTWTATGQMISARSTHTATLLPNGWVLVVGGQNNNSTFASAELYDPATGTWKATGAMMDGRASHCAALLPDGKVLVAGGFDGGFTSFIVTLSSAEFYDSASGICTGHSDLNTAREFPTATLLPKGEVLIVAGYDDNASGWISSAEIYDSVPGPNNLVNATKLPDGVFQFAFTGAAEGTNIVLATTNPELPVASWEVLGTVPEFSPGLYLFSDPQAVNNPQRFYRVRSR